MKCKISVVMGDITKIGAEAIVNAANSGLRRGGGVDGAIHRAAGASIVEECSEYIAKNGSCPAGNAMITSAGKIPSRYIIHAVGPVWHGGSENEPELLASAYGKSLELAVKNNVKTIAFPNISTGIYGYPKLEAAKIAVDTVNKFLKHDTSLEEVVFCCFERENFDIYMNLLKL